MQKHFECERRPKPNRISWEASTPWTVDEAAHLSLHSRCIAMSHSHERTHKAHKAVDGMFGMEADPITRSRSQAGLCTTEHFFGW